MINAVIEGLKRPQTIDNAVKYLLEIQERQSGESKLLNAYLREQKDIESSIQNIVANMERGVVAKATVNRLNELEARQEELERLIIIERSKQTVKLTEAQMRTFYEQALQAEPQMLITYFVKEIIVYEDRIEIIFNSPINTSPDGERGFCFYMRNIRLNRKMILMSFLI